jgi:hypothetical protein
MSIVFMWVLCTVIVAIAASGRGRSAFAWLLISLIISPLLGGVLLALLPIIQDIRYTEIRVRCPECAELILPEARVCKHCGARFAQHPPALPPPTDASENIEPFNHPGGAPEPSRLYALALLIAALIVMFVIMRSFLH